MAEINLKARLLIVTLLAISSVLLCRLFPSDFGSILFLIEITGFIFSYFVGLYFFKSTPFKGVPYVILGAFIGIVLDIIVFPDFNGFDRNLFPIEIATHVIISVVLSSCLATISFFILKASSKKV